MMEIICRHVRDCWNLRLPAWRASLPWLRLLLARVVGMPLALLANLTLGRLLGPDLYGVYATYLSVALVGASFAVLGADKVVVRELAKLPDVARGPALRVLLRWLVTAHSVSLGVVGLAFLGWLGWDLSRGGDAEAVLGAVTIVPFYAVTLLVAGVLVGFSRVDVAQSLDNVVRNFVLLSGAMAAWVCHLRSIVLLLVLQAGAYAVAAAFGWLYLALVVRPAWREGAKVLISRSQGRALQKSSMLFFIGGAATALISRFDVILVSLFGTVYQAGLFGAANRFAQLGGIVALTVMYKLQPVFSRAGGMSAAELQRVLVRGRVASFGLTLILLCGGLLFPALILGLMGRPFLAAAPAFRILLLGYLAISLTTPDVAFLAMSGRETSLARIAWAQLGLISLLTACLVPACGAEGGAVAYLCATTAASASVVQLTRRVVAGRRDMNTGAAMCE
jgi:O-antigen/teichoic acid export membrane protein